MTRWARALFTGVAVILIVLGLAMRFSWTNWSQGANLHPDEYGLTNTLTQLSFPDTFSAYFNTRLSPLSPYARYDLNGDLIANGPDNGMRWGQWPITLLRAAGELTGNTGYDEIRLLGRKLSAAADALSILLLFLTGRRLYGEKVALLAAALSSLAVLQIQQSHFMTVDNFAGLFAMVALYACVRIAQRPCAVRSASVHGTGRAHPYTFDWGTFNWFLLFGIALGMALASKINLLPLGGMVLVAGFIGIADLKLSTIHDLRRIFGITALCLGVAFLAAALTFRITQPMSFRNPSGDTGFLSFHLNPDWVDNMRRAQTESNGIGAGPPGEQWTARPILVFPLANLLLWGMGLPLGIMSWAGFFWALWRLTKTGDGWRAHLIPLVWTGGYFAFMGTRWVASMRYFLPIYPWLCLFAAWGLAEIWRRSRAKLQAKPSGDPKASRLIIPLAAGAVVVLGTLVWAVAFTNAVYRHDPTRVQATRWILQNVPAPFTLVLRLPDGTLTTQPVPAADGQQITNGSPYTYPFIPTSNSALSTVIIPHASVFGQNSRLLVEISEDAEGSRTVDKVSLPVSGTSVPVTYLENTGEFSGAALEAGKMYFLRVSTPDDQVITFYRSVIANESWDEGLPFPFDGWDPFGQLYRGVTLEVRWADDENKRQMFIDALSQVDTIILPSQRAIWSTCRLPLTYPMTMEYYRALFDGRLGFDRVATFTAPIQIGPLWISDVGGSAAWNRDPDLPLFNNRLLAAEEAFSVYDHPPVWIFKKRPDFDLEAVKQILGSIDLSKVVVQSPRDAAGPPCE